MESIGSLRDNVSSQQKPNPLAALMSTKKSPVKILDENHYRKLPRSLMDLPFQAWTSNFLLLMRQT